MDHAKVLDIIFFLKTCVSVITRIYILCCLNASINFETLHYIVTILLNGPNLNAVQIRQLRNTKLKVRLQAPPMSK